MDLANELEALEEQEQYQDNISWPIFLPDEWAKDLGMLKKEDHKLSEEEIKAYAVEITALRLEIMEKAIRKDKPYVDPRKSSGSLFRLPGKHSRTLSLTKSGA